MLEFLNDSLTLQMRNLPQTGSYLLKNIFIEYVIRDAWTRKYHYNIVIHADHR